MQLVSEQRTVLVERSQIAKFTADAINDGWHLDLTQPGRNDDEIEMRLSKQHDINAPAVKNGPR